MTNNEEFGSQYFSSEKKNREARTFYDRGEVIMRAELMKAACGSKSLLQMKTNTDFALLDFQEKRADEQL